MLSRLRIKDFTIVDQLDLEFAQGFGALTGETGAGKSILVDALALTLGERGDATAVRAGCERADISAEFVLEADGEAVRWLVANDFADDSAMVLLRRVVDSGGRSRGYINGTPATASQLRDLGEYLADIHGQHAHHALLRADAQRGLLDAMGGLTDQAREVARRFRIWHELRAVRAAAEADRQSSAREHDMLAWQLAEFERLGFDSVEWQELNEEHRRLAHAATLLEGASENLQSLDESEDALLVRLRRAAARVEELSGFDARLGETAAMLDGAASQIGEAVRTLRHYRDALELDPQRLGEVEARIAAVTELARKHRVAPERLGELRASLEARMAELGLLADPAGAALREQAAARDYGTAAEALAAGRQLAAEKLSRAVSDSMQALGMRGGQFMVALEALKEGSAQGLEAVEFRVCAAAGQSLRPLAKVASGGELARIGLAIQVIASTAGSAATLIFDEVDSGIGGATAEVVGRLLRQLGTARQVLCVTHLPQVAAQADWQWQVAKQEQRGTMASRVRVLDRDQRVEEIARMLGGVRITDATLRHAREMLAQRLQP